MAAQPRDAAGDRAARHQPADAGDPAPDQQRLRPLPAPRARRRVGLRPRLEAAGLPPDLRRVAARRTARPRRCCTPGSTSTPPRSCCPRARSWFGERDRGDAARHDIVLDVQQIRRWASSVGTPRHLGRRRGRRSTTSSSPGPRCAAAPTTTSTPGSGVGGGAPARRQTRKATSAATPTTAITTRSRSAAAGGRRSPRSGPRSPTRGRSGRRRPSRCRRPR